MRFRQSRSATGKTLLVSIAAVGVLTLAAAPASGAPTGARAAPLPIAATYQPNPSDPGSLDVTVANKSSTYIYDITVTVPTSVSILQATGAGVGICPTGTVTGHAVKFCATLQGGGSAKLSLKNNKHVNPCWYRGLSSGAASGQQKCGVVVEATGPGGADSGLVDATYTGPCECEAVDAFVNNFKYQKVLPLRPLFRVNWELTCTAGLGAGCSGVVVAHPLPGTQFVGQRIKGQVHQRTVPQSQRVAARVNCAGPCDKTTVGWSELSFLTKSGETPDLKGKTLRMQLVLFCRHGTGGVPTVVGVRKLKFVFNQRGGVDYQHSDLNGDKKPDKGELH